MNHFSANKIAALVGKGRGLVTAEATPNVIRVCVWGRPELRHLGGTFAPSEPDKAVALATAIAVPHRMPLLLWLTPGVSSDAA